MNARDFIPGVPSAGHLTPAGAFWHPGPAASCRKPACDPEQRALPSKSPAEMSDDMLRGAYTMTVLLGREAGNQPPVYRRLEALAAELDRRGIERPVVPS